MRNQSVFVDLSNFYGQLLQSNIGPANDLKRYFVEWLDLDALAFSLANEFPTVWVFYSGQRIGPSSERIQGSHLDDLVRRLDALQGVTTRNANISGDQREIGVYTCKQCGNQGNVEWVSEKGVDASLSVQLFDTMESWDVAYLLSGDADFVPAVTSLRRRGKIVIGAGFPSKASPALIRECYSYVDLVETYLRRDFLAYKVFRPAGLAETFLEGDSDQAAYGSYDFSIDDRSAARGDDGDSEVDFARYQVNFHCATDQSSPRTNWLREQLRGDYGRPYFKGNRLGEHSYQWMMVFDGPNSLSVGRRMTDVIDRLRAKEQVETWKEGTGFTRNVTADRGD